MMGLLAHAVFHPNFKINMVPAVADAPFCAKRGQDVSEAVICSARLAFRSSDLDGDSREEVKQVSPGMSFICIFGYSTQGCSVAEAPQSSLY